MLLTQINDQMAQLRPSERRVADFVQARPRIAAEITIADLAEAVGVSEPTVMRFCRAVGCRGFQDLKRQLQGDLARRNVVTHRPGGQKKSPSDAVSRQTTARDGVNPAVIALTAQVCLRAPSVTVFAETSELAPVVAALASALSARSIKVGGIQSASEGCVGPSLGFDRDGCLILIQAPIESGLPDPCPLMQADTSLQALHRLHRAATVAVQLCQAIEQAADGSPAVQQAQSERAWAHAHADSLQQTLSGISISSQGAVGVGALLSTKGTGR